MAPLTRNRANENREPVDMNVTYYEQRATAGLIIAEATQICPQGQRYISTPGIYSEGQIEGWKKVTDAVHKKKWKDLFIAFACRSHFTQRNFNEQHAATGTFCN
jgi:N-ethylmaleimide reductase